MPSCTCPWSTRDADLVLAGQIAESIDSAELYVVWTAEHGQSTPEVVAELPSRRRPSLAPSLHLPGDPRAVGRHAPQARAGHPRAAPPRRAGARPPPQAASTAASVDGRLGRAASAARAVLLLGRLGALARPRLVELDAPLAVLALLEREARAERLARAALEAGHRRAPCGPSRSAPWRPPSAASCRPCSSRSRSRSPDPRATSTRSPCGSRRCPARRPGTGPRLARGMRTSLSFASSSATVPRANSAMSLHEALARLLAVLDPAEPVLPVAGQAGRRERVLVEQPDHVQALLRADQRAAVALDVADVDQPLDDRARAWPACRCRSPSSPRAARRRRRACRRSPSPRAATRRSSAAAAWSPSPPTPTSSVRDVLALLELRQRLVGALVVVGGRAVLEALAVDAAPARHDQHPAARAEDVLGDRGLQPRVLEHRVGMEDGEEAAHDHVVDAPVVVGHLVDVVLGPSSG